MAKYIPRIIISILCLTILVISTVSCININMPQSPTENKTSQGNQGTTPPAGNTSTSIELPTISSFTADPVSVFEGKSSRLSWLVNNADSIVLTPGIGKVEARNFVTVTPTVKTTYTLVASNETGMNSEAVTVDIITLSTGKVVREAGEIKKPDLVIKGYNISDKQDGKYIDTILRNYGTANSAPCKLSLIPPGVGPFTQDIEKVLKPGETYVSTFPHKLTPTDTKHMFIFKVDADNSNNELFEDNNTYGFSLHYK